MLTVEGQRVVGRLRPRPSVGLLSSFPLSAQKNQSPKGIWNGAKFGGKRAFSPSSCTPELYPRNKVAGGDGGGS